MREAVITGMTLNISSTLGEGVLGADARDMMMCLCSQ